MAVTPRHEQESNIMYDPVTKQWHYYSDVPAHNKKWEHLIEPQRITVEDNGVISLLEGTVIGNVTISKKRKLSEEQRAAASERLAATRNNAA